MPPSIFGQRRAWEAHFCIPSVIQNEGSFPGSIDRRLQHCTGIGLLFDRPPDVGTSCGFDMSPQTENSKTGKHTYERHPQLFRVSVRSSRQNQRDLEIALTHKLEGAEANDERMTPVGMTLSYERLQT